MKLKGQNPLAQAGIGDEQRQLLRSLWIDSIEEAIAASAAVGDSHEALERAGLKTLAASPQALQAVSPERLSQVRVARQGGGLGCLVDEQVLEDFRRIGRLRPTRATPSGAFEARLPIAVRLMDRMPPVRDQGQRGTCVAFGAVALREFLMDRRNDLSEQFLYWACKELDGHPGPGTYIHTAMSALSQYGVCLEATWPYNPSQTDDEGHGPPPPGANDDARSYRLDSTRTVEPNLVIHYKHVLAGDHAVDGMPVTFGSLVFNSWYMSSETHRTGKITLPLPGETPAGGHAWCIVGYVDNEDVPGGGYFIIRNSWGTTWAADSPESPGHAMMPYEYVERYAFEAFTGPLHGSTMPDQQTAVTFDQCVRVLKRDDREELDSRPRAGRLLKAGVRVLEDRFARDIFREASHENEEAFRRRDCTWSDDSWRKAWFLEPARFSAEAAAKLESARTAKGRFASAIHQNVMSADGSPFPRLRVPWWFTFVPFEWEPTVKSVEQVADLTDAVVESIQERGGPPAGLAWPKSWHDLLAGCNDVKVYTVRRYGEVAHVVSAFVTPVQVQQQAAPIVAPLDQTLIDAVQKAYSTWRQAQSGPKPVFTFLTIGGEDCPSAEASVAAAGDHWLLLSCPDGTGRWKTSMPRRFGDRPSIRDFVDRLKPETAPERVSRIKDCVDELIPEGGNVTAERVKNRTGYRKSVVRRAFLTLQDQAGDAYRVYKATDGQYAIRQSRPSEKISVRAGSLRRSFVRQHGLRLLGAAVGVGGWLIRDMFDISGATGFVVLVLLVYMTSCIQGAINRHADDNKE
jgi:hypothetical protein